MSKSNKSNKTIKSNKTSKSIPEIDLDDSLDSYSDENSNYLEEQRQKKIKKHEDKMKQRIRRRKDIVNGVLRKKSSTSGDDRIVNDSVTEFWNKIKHKPPEKVRAAPEALVLFDKKTEKAGITRKLRKVKSSKFSQTKKSRK
jgi:hypothetical protein